MFAERVENNVYQDISFWEIKARIKQIYLIDSPDCKKGMAQKYASQTLRAFCRLLYQERNQYMRKAFAGSRFTGFTGEGVEFILNSENVEEMKDGLTHPVIYGCTNERLRILKEAIGLCLGNKASG